ncbi:hypothetical protein ACFFKU_07150 [Kineococcus gynurae]|uniref:Uncharacterized protein n=1 Tax=Kineococcus gynurae TaxID=452979 RepID=A0ABV5LWR5_9ACTN
MAVMTEQGVALPTPRRARTATASPVRAAAATATIRTSLEESGCILVGAAPSAAGCSIAFYDIRSLHRAVEVIATAATRAGDGELAGRARQRGGSAWSVTAVANQWLGPDGDPARASTRSSTSWYLEVPQADLVPVAAALLV